MLVLQTIFPCMSNNTASQQIQSLTFVMGITYAIIYLLDDPLLHVLYIAILNWQ